MSVYNDLSSKNSYTHHNHQPKKTTCMHIVVLSTLWVQGSRRYCNLLYYRETVKTSTILQCQKQTSKILLTSSTNFAW